MTTEKKTDEGAIATLASETDRIYETLMCMLKRLVHDGTPEHSQESVDGASDTLKTIKLWISTTLTEAEEVGCHCPPCQYAMNRLRQVMAMVDDGIVQLEGHTAKNAIEAAFSLGSCSAQLVLIPALATTMSHMAQSAHDMAREILKDKIVELTVEGEPCSDCGACHEGPEDDNQGQKPN